MESDDASADQAFLEAIRLTAYFLWEQDGRPAGREWDYWRLAQEQHARQADCDRLLAASQVREARGETGSA